MIPRVERGEDSTFLLFLREHHHQSSVSVSVSVCPSLCLCIGVLLPCIEGLGSLSLPVPPPPLPCLWPHPASPPLISLSVRSCAALQKRTERRTGEEEEEEESSSSTGGTVWRRRLQLLLKSCRKCQINLAHFTHTFSPSSLLACNAAAENDRSCGSLWTQAPMSPSWRHPAG